MPDLKTRFRGADRIPAPHLWTKITGREPRLQGREAGPARKFLVATVAFAIGVAGVIIAVRLSAAVSRRLDQTHPRPSVRSQPPRLASSTRSAWDARHPSPTERAVCG